MKKSFARFVVPLAALFFSTAFLFSSIPTAASPQHGFSVKQYEEFHDVLHPLEHEALPNNDFRRIRAQSALLVRRGRAIVKLGMPSGVSEENKEEFRERLATFNKALNRFKISATKGSNAQLKTTYSAVHDSFEMLASSLPRG